jgi:hypothetical protein
MTPHSLAAQEFSIDGQLFVGTLYLPEGDGWYPAVVVAGEDPGEAAAHFLLGLGLAVLTFDAPGAGLQAAAQAAADSLLMRPDIRPELIGLLGVGASAWAAALAAARAPETAFAVLIPGGTPAPANTLPRLGSLYCPVLALVEDEATSAALAKHLAHNDEARIEHVGRGSTELGEEVLAVVGPWVRVVMA